MNPLTIRSIGRAAVGSTNRVKIGAVRDVLARAGAPVVVEGVAVASDVPDQPHGDEETIRGARTRAERARAAIGADIGIGIEGGVVPLPDGSMRTCAWAVVIDRDGRVGMGGSLAMPLPPAVAAMIREGLELGDAMDRLTGGCDTKFGAGASGILTAGLVDRQRAYESLVTYALAPWL
ncbi:MAG TPA: inosine/xanthosine triphosphatase, partial [Gemmatimonadaceae bacterium]|nr:inosine/xanthosine triphosphatase [Gemmatimonadaceae bacterium]